MKNQKYQCSKCGNTPENKYPIIFYSNRYFCRHCYQKAMLKIEQDIKKKDMIQLMHEANAEKEEEEPELDLENFIIERIEFPPIPKPGLTPKEIVAYLDRFVIGQEQAKKTLSVAVYNHYKRVNSSESQMLPKSNILMAGPTGSGKTFLLKTLANLLSVPLAIVDASTITEASYKGKDVESVLTSLYWAADKDLEKAQRGIVYLDEFDKLSASLGHRNDGSTVGEGVQRQLLKMIEGSQMDIPKEGVRMNNNIPTIQINTENILFVCGGAFVGIHKEEENKKRRIGYLSKLEGSDSQPTKKRLTPHDFIEYGIIPEMAGRLPIIVEWDALTEKDLINILLHSESSFIKAYQNMLKEDDVELIFEKEAIEEMAHIAFEKGTGARGLNSIIEGIMEELMYEIPSDASIRKCIITKEVVLGNLKPIIERSDTYGGITDN